MLRLLPALILLTACGTNSKPAFIGTDKDFLTQLNSFESDCNMDLKDYPIHFGETKYNVFGLCERYKSGARQILINKVKWKKLTSERKLVLIYHELGHCVLNRDHDDTEMLDTNGTFIPTSIMNTYLLSNYEYVGNETYYKTELYKNRR